MRASESDRGVACPASLVLPRHELRTARTDEAADWGTLCHHWKETGETDPDWATVNDVVCLQKKIRVSGVRRDDYWPPGLGTHEVSFAIELQTAQLHMYRGARAEAERWKAKWDPQRYLTGTIDWLDWGAEDRWPSVDDLKTGRWDVDPRTSLQHRSYALVPWIHAGRPSRFWVGVTTTKWERPPEENARWSTWDRWYTELPQRTPIHWCSALELACHLDDCLHAVTHPGEANPEPLDTRLAPDGTPAPWDPKRKLSVCAFCPCREPLPLGLDNYRYRAEQHCTPGILARLRRGE